MNAKDDFAELERDDQSAATRPSPRNSTGNPRRFTLWQRFQLFIANWAGFFVLQLVGRTARWEVHGWENWEAARKTGKGLIYTFWHREISAATWFWRKRGIVVMSSTNFDGEITARIVLRSGYGLARGSSSHGASRALVEMVRCHRRGLDTAFTIDGPRGPRYVAKAGSVMLAKATGAAILCFHIAVRRAYVFKRSWDFFEIPLPFTRAAVFIAPPITVARHATADEQEAALQRVQATLDDLSRKGDAWRTRCRQAGQ